MGVPVAPSSPGPKTFQDFRKKARGPYLDEFTNQHTASYMQKTTTKQKTKNKRRQKTNKQNKTTKNNNKTKEDKKKQNKTKKKHEKG